MDISTLDIKLEKDLQCNQDIVILFVLCLFVDEFLNVLEEVLPEDERFMLELEGGQCFKGLQESQLVKGPIVNILARQAIKHPIDLGDCFERGWLESAVETIHPLSTQQLFKQLTVALMVCSQVVFHFACQLL